MIHVNEKEAITAPTHPFYVPKLGWTSAIKLRAGDILVLSNGEYVVVEAVQHEILESPIKVYNFEVEDFHTYFVGESSVLVHNRCGSGGVELSSNGSEISNDILDKPRKGSALTIDEVKSIRDGKNNIIKEFPSVAQSHGFNDIVDNYAGYADVFDIPNGKLYQLKGSLNGISGRFE